MRNGTIDIPKLSSIITTEEEVDEAYISLLARLKQKLLAGAFAKPNTATPTHSANSLRGRQMTKSVAIEAKVYIANACIDKYLSDTPIWETTPNTSPTEADTKNTRSRAALLLGLIISV